MLKDQTKRKHVQMLRCFMDAYKRMLQAHVKTLYEFHLLVRNEYGNLQKVYRFELGTSYLPDNMSEYADDCYITMLRKDEIEYLLKECDKYGIK